MEYKITMKLDGDKIVTSSNMNELISEQELNDMAEHFGGNDICVKKYDGFCDCSKCMLDVEQAIEDSRNK